MLVKRAKIDYWTFLVVLVLLGIGLVMVLSASQYFAQNKPYEDSFYFLKAQAKNAILGIVVMVLAMNINYQKYRKLVWPALIGAFLLMMLIALTSLGSSAKGAEQWLDLGFVRFQPSEIMKIALVLFLAKSLSERREMLSSFSKGFLPYLALIGVVCVAVALQDLGTAMVIAGTAFIMLYCSGTRPAHLMMLVGAGIAFFVFMVMLEPYRMNRLLGFMDPWSDPLGTGYQTIQSLLAIGSGGFTGVGLGAGGAKWLYLPERHTDFIFAVMAEETGLLGGAFLILLFMFFAWRGFNIAMKVQDSFGSLLAAGITIMISLQAFINIGIAVGALPVTGITLPFISYGGTSLVISLAAVGVLLNISRFAGMDR